jgi:hypothetical protein
MVVTRVQDGVDLSGAVSGPPIVARRCAGRPTDRTAQRSVPSEQGPVVTGPGAVSTARARTTPVRRGYRGWVADRAVRTGGNPSRIGLVTTAVLLVPSVLLVPVVAACSDRDVTGAATDRQLLDGEQELHFDQLVDWPAAGELAESYAVAWPPSARDLHLLQGGFQDPYYLARLTIDGHELSQLLEPALCDELQPVDEVAPAVTGIDGPEWWTPGEAVAACAGSAGNQHQQLAVTDPDGDEITVYISTFST